MTRYQSRSEDLRIVKSNWSHTTKIGSLWSYLSVMIISSKILKISTGSSSDLADQRIVQCNCMRDTNGLNQPKSGSLRCNLPFMTNSI